MAGGRGLLDHRGVLLGDLVHLVDRGVHLMQPGRLLLGRPGDLRHHGGDLAHLGHDARQGLTGVADQLDALADLLRGRGNQRLDLLCRLRRALRQGTHFAGHHREAAPGVAGPRCLDARVQREQVGLERNLVDHADDLADLPRRLLDAAHGRNRLIDDVARLLGVGLGARDDLVRLLGPFRRLAGRWR